MPCSSYEYVHCHVATVHVCTWLACYIVASTRWEVGTHSAAVGLLSGIICSPLSLPAQRQLDDVVLCYAFVYFEKIILMVRM